MANQSDEKNETIPDATLSDAATWFTLLQSKDLCLNERKEFDQWLNEASINETAYCKVSSTWLDLEVLGENTYIKNATNEALKAKCNKGSAQNFFYRNRYVAQAASFLFMISIGFLMYYVNQNESAIHFKTTIGKQSTIDLADGSTVILDTNSRLYVAYSRDQRLLSLEKGQAHFIVTPDKDRPFIVRTGQGEITALGTAFDVRLDESRTIVKLVEGVVDVSLFSLDDKVPKNPNTILNAGEKISIENGKLTTVESFDPVQVKAWKMGKVIFSDTPLDKAIIEINRYTKKKYVLEDEKIGNVKISGVYNIHNTESFTKSLVTYFPIQAKESSNSTIVLSYLTE